MANRYDGIGTGCENRYTDTAPLSASDGCPLLIALIRHVNSFGTFTSKFVY
ncbi:unnamed protein product [Anisakis simplex]|uniref:Uncharacterized protein n=1 Tax=Anisakis simplex TaxID=6269 RepID=A0A0M3KKR2_ANISI|nr:unnamed protein product [Anisakis simplex]